MPVSDTMCVNLSRTKKTQLVQAFAFGTRPSVSHSLRDVWHLIRD